MKKPYIIKGTIYLKQDFCFVSGVNDIDDDNELYDIIKDNLDYIIDDGSLELDDVSIRDVEKCEE